MAVSIVSIAAEAWLLVTPRPLTDRSDAETLAKLSVSTSLDSDPTWKVRSLSSKTVAPANRVRVPIASSSSSSSSTSACSATPSLVAVLAAETARSRIRCRIECTSLSAPSAVCTSEIPSCALRIATREPFTSLRRASDFTSPAASSAARLIRNPDDSFSRLLPSSTPVPERFR